MICRVLVVCFLTFLGGRSLGQAPARPPKPTGDGLPPKLIEVPLQDKAPVPGRALQYGLLPSPYTTVAGNAAPHWARAGLAAVEVTRRVPAKDWDALTEEGPLEKFPREEAEKVLQTAATALRMAEQASRYDHCYWAFEPMTIQAMDLPLTEIQALRSLAQLLSLQCRVLLLQRRFDDAARTLQIGLVLGRHTGDGPIMVQNLVGVAIASIMLQRVQEWIQLPDAPNLYWPLTALPTPFISDAAAIHNEAGVVFRSFPQLRTLAKEPLPKQGAERLATELVRGLAPLSGGAHSSEWEMRLGIATLAAKVYPQAKEYLLQHGRKLEDIEAMLVLQVVLLYTVEQYDEIWDEVFKWLYLPYWQSRPGLEQLDKRVRLARTENLNIFVGLLMPAVLKVREANIRLERHIAVLRCVEAIRLHAARNGGRPPKAINDINAVPLPVDPVTGTGLDAFYKVEDEKAILDVPPFPPKVLGLARRFVFVPPMK
jgi:hypothetical protein